MSSKLYIVIVRSHLDPELFLDGTNNYIRGKTPSDVDADADFSDSLERSGLAVVTVLIGVFDRKSGKPLAGVVNQPFVRFNRSENQ